MKWLEREPGVRSLGAEGSRHGTLALASCSSFPFPEHSMLCQVGGRGQEVPGLALWKDFIHTKSVGGR